MNELQVRLCPVDQLVPYQKNARTHSEEQIAQIAASIQAFGWTSTLAKVAIGLRVCDEYRKV